MSRKQQRRKEGGVDDIDTQVQSELLLEMTIMASEPGLITPEWLPPFRQTHLKG